MMKVRIITPSGLYLETDNVIEVNARSVEGEFGILSDHMPMVAMLEISKLELVFKDERQEYAVSGGMLQFKENLVTILTDSVEGVEEIDLARAEAAKIRAEKRLHNEQSNVNMRRAEIALRKAINRINVKHPEN